MGDEGRHRVTSLARGASLEGVGCSGRTFGGSQTGFMECKGGRQVMAEGSCRLGRVADLMPWGSACLSLGRAQAAALVCLCCHPVSLSEHGTKSNSFNTLNRLILLMSCHGTFRLGLNIL